MGQLQARMHEIDTTAVTVELRVEEGRASW